MSSPTSNMDKIMIQISHTLTILFVTLLLQRILIQNKMIQYSTVEIILDLLCMFYYLRIVYIIVSPMRTYISIQMKMKQEDKRLKSYHDGRLFINDTSIDNDFNNNEYIHYTNKIIEEEDVSSLHDLETDDKSDCDPLMEPFAIEMVERKDMIRIQKNYNEKKDSFVSDSNCNEDKKETISSSSSSSSTSTVMDVDKRDYDEYESLLHHGIRQNHDRKINEYDVSSSFRSRKKQQSQTSNTLKESESQIGTKDYLSHVKGQ